MGFRRIFIAVDSEPIAARAADTGIELAKALGAEVALIHVVDTSVALGGDTGIPPNVLIAEAEREGKKLVAGFRERLSLPASTLQFVQSGSPPGEIVKAATEWAADLIVIGSHGRAGLRRALVGSVAEGVMRHAPCPVLVTRANRRRVRYIVWRCVEMILSLLKKRSMRLRTLIGRGVVRDGDACGFEVEGITALAPRSAMRLAHGVAVVGSVGDDADRVDRPPNSRSTPLLNLGLAGRSG